MKEMIAVTGFVPRWQRIAPSIDDRLTASHDGRVD